MDEAREKAVEDTALHFQIDKKTVKEDLSRFSFKQFQPQLLFEGSHLIGDRRLGDGKVLGCPGVAHASCHAMKDSEVVKVYHLNNVLCHTNSKIPHLNPGQLA